MAKTEVEVTENENPPERRGRMMDSPSRTSPRRPKLAKYDPHLFRYWAVDSR